LLARSGLRLSLGLLRLRRSGLLLGRIGLRLGGSGLLGRLSLRRRRLLRVGHGLRRRRRLCH
jgi:hypothetical protein